MITALALAATVTACHADLLATFEQAKVQAVSIYPQHAAQIHNIKARVGAAPEGLNAQVVYGGTKLKLPKGWGFVPVDYTHRVTFDSTKLCAMAPAERNEIVRHEVGHVLARFDRGEVIVDEEAVADAYGATLAVQP